MNPITECIVYSYILINTIKTMSQHLSQLSNELSTGGHRMSGEDLRELRSRQDRQQQREAKFAAVRQRVGSLFTVLC